MDNDEEGRKLADVVLQAVKLTGPFGFAFRDARTQSIQGLE